VVPTRWGNYYCTTNAHKQEKPTTITWKQIATEPINNNNKKRNDSRKRERSPKNNNKKNKKKKKKRKKKEKETNKNNNNETNTNSPCNSRDHNDDSPTNSHSIGQPNPYDQQQAATLQYPPQAKPKATDSFATNPTDIKIVSQNVQGLQNEEKLEYLARIITKHDIKAYLIQETHLAGNFTMQISGRLQNKYPLTKRGST